MRARCGPMPHSSGNCYAGGMRPILPYMQIPPLNRPGLYSRPAIPRHAPPISTPLCNPFQRVICLGETARARLLVVVEPTLDNFGGRTNAELVQHLRALALARTKERFVYLWGASGSGRTHLVGGDARRMCGDRFIGCLRLRRDCGVVAAGARRGSPRGCGKLRRPILSQTAQVALFNLYNTLLDRPAGA